MTKKEYVVKLLTALLDEWPLARGLLMLVEQNKFSDETLSALTEIFKQAVHTVSSKIKQDKLQKSADYLQRLQQKEQDEQMGEDELNDLLD